MTLREIWLLPDFFAILVNMVRMNAELYYPELSYRICGLCFKVHNQLGRFRSERQYADAQEVLLQQSKVVYQREVFLPPSFKGEKNRNKPDFLIDDKIVLDLKAKSVVTKEDYFQMLRYLDSADIKLGIIVNFRQKYLRPKRVVRSTH